MAELKSSDDPELFLPSHFLSDPEFFLPSHFILDPKSDPHMNKNNHFQSSTLSLTFPTEFPYEFDSFGANSVLNSPVASAVSSTETESSGEDDFFAGLSQRLARFSLHDSQKPTVPTTFNLDKLEKTKWGMTISPQSTLSGIENWSGRSQSEMNSIYEAAGQIAMLKMNNEAAKYMNNNHLQNRMVLGTRKSSNAISEVYASHVLTQNHPQRAQFQQVRRDQVLNPQCASVAWGGDMNVGWSGQQIRIQNRERNLGYENGRFVRSFDFPESAWPVKAQQRLNQQTQNNGLAMRAVVGGVSGSKRETTGTGVFLPRTYLPKPSRNTAKVNSSSFDELNGPGLAHSSNTMIAIKHEAAVAQRNAMLTQRWLRSLRTESSVKREIRLPQDWTY